MLEELTTELTLEASITLQDLGPCLDHSLSLSPNPSPSSGPNPCLNPYPNLYIDLYLSLSHHHQHYLYPSPSFASFSQPDYPFC